MCDVPQLERPPRPFPPDRLQVHNTWRYSLQPVTCCRLMGLLSSPHAQGSHSGLLGHAVYQRRRPGTQTTARPAARRGARRPGRAAQRGGDWGRPPCRLPLVRRGVVQRAPHPQRRGDPGGRFRCPGGQSARRGGGARRRVLRALGARSATRARARRAAGAGAAGVTLQAGDHRRHRLCAGQRPARTAAAATTCCSSSAAPTSPTSVA